MGVVLKKYDMKEDVVDEELLLMMRIQMNGILRYSYRQFLLVYKAQYYVDRPNLLPAWKVSIGSLTDDHYHVPRRSEAVYHTYR